MTTTITSHLQALYEYNFEMNERIISVFVQSETGIPEKSLKLLSHIVNAHQIWNARISSGEPRGVWQINALDENRALNSGNCQQTFRILQETGLSSIISYTNSKGETFSNSVGDILFHVINHSTYHRAQIATDMRQNGIEPPATDYIFYKRVRIAGLSC